ncbi:toxin-antitoxin system TumE family protein [Spirosoma spitsbergense]|uniref:toxin-antitoxin system TumE family protein n=1 Tax=Spirosoma spitsbergense TaxID=431554 RepID=UPI00037E7956|nr:DUF6516 family protein [Spirosoma spitsbergense]
MKEIVDPFSVVIRSTHFEIEKVADQKLIERCTVVFVDGSRLSAYESQTGSKFKYGYHWMDKDDQTMYRWDNAAHFPQFDTYPYHRHVAEPYPIMTLSEVLHFIRLQLTPSSQPNHP